MSAVLAPDKKMQKLDGPKRLGPCTHPQHVKISSEIEVLGPRNGRGVARPRHKPASNPASISQYPQCSKCQNFQTIGQITPQINSKKSLQAEPEENQLEDLEFQLSPFLWG